LTTTGWPCAYLFTRSPRRLSCIDRSRLPGLVRQRFPPTALRKTLAMPHILDDPARCTGSVEARASSVGISATAPV
jgi:hypothetical protein